MYKLEITIGYGEHCDDMFTQSYMEIDDEKALKYRNLTDEESNEMGWTELSILSHCITKELAEKIVKFFNSLWNRETGKGYKVNHIVLNYDCDRYWWTEEGCMTEEEFEWFSGIYDNYYTLFCPRVGRNCWYGVVGARIVYKDEKGNMSGVM